jgi:uncharacterized damage-inducible protein DinB
MKRLFVTLARANRWANSILYPELAKLSPEALARPSAVTFGSILGIANHLLLADRLWMHRITGRGERLATVDAIPYPEFDGLISARMAEDERLMAMARDLDPATLDRPLDFTTIEGTPRSVNLACCLAHVFTHQTHHRGQMHALLGEHGVKARDIDLLYFPGLEKDGE